MEGEEAVARAAVSILDVLRVDLCARKILNYLSIADLVRSERVCTSWQRALHHYLHGCRDLGFYDVEYNYRHRANEISYHRNIRIFPTKRSLQFACKMLQKLGTRIVGVTTERTEEEYFEVIASACVHLRKLDIDIKDEHYRLSPIKKFNKLQHVSIYFHGYTYSDVDRALGDVFQDIDCEKISIDRCWSYTDITGSFLNSVKSKNFKSLELNTAPCLDVMTMLSATDNLRNLTILNLDSCGKIIRNVHLLLDKLPLLEELSLQHYDDVIFCQISIESISRLTNLKRLNLSYNYCVTDALLEAVAMRCVKLEYVNIMCCITMYDDRDRDATRVTWRGVAALCRRSPAAVTNIDHRYTVVNGERTPSGQDLLPYIEYIVRTEAYYNAQGGRGPGSSSSKNTPQAFLGLGPKLDLILFYHSDSP